MNEIIFILIEIAVVGASVLAHMVVAYRYAPLKARDGIMEATEDGNYMARIVAALVNNFFKPMQWQNSEGKTVNASPVDLISEKTTSQIEGFMKSWIGGQQSQMVQELEKNAQNALSNMPSNPFVGLILQQVPKKYLPYVQLLANYLIQSQQQSL